MHDFPIRKVANRTAVLKVSMEFLFKHFETVALNSSERQESSFAIAIAKCSFEFHDIVGLKFCLQYDVPILTG